MIPLRDTIPSRHTPLVNYGLMVLCTLVFLYQFFFSRDFQNFILTFALIPARYQYLTAVDPFNWMGRYLPFFTAIFLHGGWLHFLSNMLYLWIFGDNVEDSMGHGLYLLFFLSTGFFAFFTHYLLHASSPVPTLGASGAIAGVMGAYFLFYPQARIVTLVPIFFFVQIIEIPAVAFLFLWFIIQFYAGTTAWLGGSVGGVAWWVHVGGFLSGYFIARLILEINRRNRRGV